jgi:preprotein translocase subunit SecY
MDEIFYFRILCNPKAPHIFHRIFGVYHAWLIFFAYFLTSITFNPIEVARQK